MCKKSTYSITSICGTGWAAGEVSTYLPPFRSIWFHDEREEEKTGTRITHVKMFDPPPPGWPALRPVLEFSILDRVLERFPALLVGQVRGKYGKASNATELGGASLTPQLPEEGQI